MSDWTDHRCYYADPSGGFGWPSCVICGAPLPLDPARWEVRACCKTSVDTEHVPTCPSLDAVQRRRRARMA